MHLHKEFIMIYALYSTLESSCDNYLYIKDVFPQKVFTLLHYPLLSCPSISTAVTDLDCLKGRNKKKKKDRVPTACCGAPQCAKSHNAFTVKQVQTVLQHGGQPLWHFIMNESSSFLHWKRALNAIFAHSARISNMEASFFWPVKEGNCDASIAYFSKMMTGMTGTQ